MPNEFDKSGMIHQWIYVIIPVGSQNVPYFTAFCKVCRKYFAEKISYSEGVNGKISSSSLPRYGCEPPDDIPFV
jgi:hypothetical protein